MKDRLSALAGALLFFLCFGAVGAAASWVIGATVYDWHRAQQWVRVKADVQKAAGDLSYTYAWQGKPYVGSRVGTFVIGGSSEVDDFEARIDDRIRQATEAGKPITVWVNPDNPSESMLDRELRWKLLVIFVPFALGFGGVGLVVGSMMMWNALGLPTVKLKANVQQFFTTGGFALLWNGIVWPIALVLGPGAYEEGEWIPIAIVGLFCLLGLLMAWSVVVLFFKVLLGGNPFETRTGGQAPRNPGPQNSLGSDPKVSRSGKVLS
jgi:hypothetical protein